MAVNRQTNEEKNGRVKEKEDRDNMNDKTRTDQRIQIAARRSCIFFPAVV